MYGPETLASITVVASFIVAVISYLLNRLYNLRKLMDRVDTLEKQSVTFLTKENHVLAESNCRREIYRDLKALEEKIERIDRRLEKSEESRDKARGEDLKWKTEMHEAIVEIRTIVKQRLSGSE